MKIADKLGLPGANAAPTNPLETLLLELEAGAFASYTVHDVKTACPVKLTARSLTGGSLRLTDGAGQETP